jgi:hypothetical protein
MDGAVFSALLTVFFYALKCYTFSILWSATEYTQ